jgi:transglutaminase/protease-like cytokinesis protein 3
MCSAPQTIAASVFNDVARGSVDLYVPSASVSAYRSAVVWKDFRVICIGCVSVTGVSVSPTTLSLKPDATQQLTATLTPDSATNKNVTWSSSNTSVASVDTNGNVTAVSAGTATITVTTDDNSKTATCVVTVSAATGVAAVELRKLQAYPNPIVNGELIIANGQLNVGDKIEIYNVNGVLVETHCRASLQGGTTINIGHLPAGIYIVKAAGRTAKVVK